MKTTERIPALAAAAATALARLPVEAQESTEKPSDLAADAATATTRSLNEWVGLPLSSLTHSVFMPSSRARLSARSRRVPPTCRSTVGVAGSRPEYRHMVGGPAAMDSRVTRESKLSS